MKTFALTFLCALCALTVTGQPSNFEEIKKEVRALKPRIFKAEYDKFTQTTSLRGSLSDSIRDCIISRSADNTFTYLISVGRSGSGWAWVSVREAIFLLNDEKRLTLTNGTRSSDTYSTTIMGRTTFRFSEELMFSITLEEWKQIFSATKVEFQVGATEHKLKYDYKKGCVALADFAARLKD